jgi:cytochrome c oxidase assembly protein subunit 15
MSKPLKIVAVLATFWILLALIAGALVTKTGSGEGCGANWPLCHGKLIPDELTLETIIEYTHRLITGVAGILVLLFSVWMAKRYRQHREVMWMVYSAIFFLLLQSALGALAVLDIGRSSAILALHFGFSLMSYASVFLLMIYAYQLDKKPYLPVPRASGKLRLGMLGLFIYTYIVVYIGAYVRHTGSTMGCEGWPLCNGQWIPELSGQTGIQFGQRVAALILVISFAVLLYHVIRYYWSDHLLRYGSLSLFILILLQAISGGYVVLMNMDLFPAMLHAFFISILFGILFYLLLYVFRKEVRSS